MPLPTAFVEIKELSEAERSCLKCTLPICDDRAKECAFVKIVRLPSRLVKVGVDVEVGPPGFMSAETREKAKEMRKKKRRERTLAALEKKRTAKMWARSQKKLALK
jgi:hypothetical protein